MFLSSLQTDVLAGVGAGCPVTFWPHSSRISSKTKPFKDLTICSIATYYTYCCKLTVLWVVESLEKETLTYTAQSRCYKPQWNICSLSEIVSWRTRVDSGFGRGDSAVRTQVNWAVGSLCHFAHLCPQAGRAGSHNIVPTGHFYWSPFWYDYDENQLRTPSSEQRLCI